MLKHFEILGNKSFFLFRKYFGYFTPPSMKFALARGTDFFSASKIGNQNHFQDGNNIVFHFWPHHLILLSIGKTHLGPPYPPELNVDHPTTHDSQTPAF